MCTNGVNIAQLKANIEQIDEAVALSRRWIHRAYHSADDAGQAKTAGLLQRSQNLMDEVRALLDEAADCAESEAAEASKVTVNLV